MTRGVFWWRDYIAGRRRLSVTGPLAQVVPGWRWLIDARGAIPRPAPDALAFWEAEQLSVAVLRHMPAGRVAVVYDGISERMADAWRHRLEGHARGLGIRLAGFTGVSAAVAWIAPELKAGTAEIPAVAG